jgi:hypothetical protein
MAQLTADQLEGLEEVYQWLTRDRVLEFSPPAPRSPAPFNHYWNWDENNRTNAEPPSLVLSTVGDERWDAHLYEEALTA